MFLLKKIGKYSCIGRTSKFSLNRSIKSASHQHQCTEESNSSRLQAQLQVIGSGASDQPSSVILRVSNKLYLFNCGEGIKRYCQNAQVNFKKISNVFFTQSKWNCIGGIISLIFMTFTNSRAPPKFHGPSDLETIFKRMIHLSALSHLFKHNFSSNVFTSNQRYEDRGVAIEPIELKSNNDIAVIYMCKIKRTRGSYSLRKFLDLNVPNEYLNKLLRNEDVILHDGTVIASADIRAPDRPEVNFLCKFATGILTVFLVFISEFYLIISVIDVPSHGFLPNLKCIEKLKDFLAETEATGVEVIVHFTPQNIFNTEEYQHLVHAIGAKRQLVVNDQNK